MLHQCDLVVELVDSCQQTLVHGEFTYDEWARLEELVQSADDLMHTKLVQDAVHKGCFKSQAATSS
jgi:hypothetical protein